MMGVVGTKAGEQGGRLAPSYQPQGDIHSPPLVPCSKELPNPR